MSSHAERAQDAIRIVRAAGGALLDQALLHGELARIEWAQEAARLQHQLLIALLGFACLLCTLLFGGALMLVATWDTAFRLPALGSLVLLFALATTAIWRRFLTSAPPGGEVFGGLRQQLAADVELLKARA